MGKKEGKPATKVLSVRLPMEEAEAIEEEARKAGLNKNDYLRLCLQSKKTFLDVDEIRDAIEAFRHIERVFDRYLTVLEGLLAQCYRSGNAQLFTRVEKEMDRASELVNLSLKAQKQAVRILTRIRRKASRD